jgi:hypothetical protein
MSIRFVYSPRFVGVALNATARALAMVKHAATRRLTVALSATRAQKTLTERTAGGPISSVWFSGEYNSAAYGTPDFYISTTGTGTAAGGGTLGDPWAISMLNNATARARYAGSVVGVMDGTYDLIAILGQHDGGFSEGELHIDGGTVGSPTVIVSQTLNGAIIDYNRPAMTNQAESAAIAPLGAYLTLDGLHVTRTNYRAITNNFQGGGNLTVRNCLFTDQSFDEVLGVSARNSATIFSVGYSGITIQNNRFEGGSAPGDGDRHSVIQFYDSEDVLIEYNTIIGDTSPPTGVCIYFKESLGTRNAEVRYNYLEKPSASNESNMMILDQGDGGDTSSVHSYHHNIIYRTGAASGISYPWFWAETGTGTTGTLTFYNNVFYGPVDYLGGLIRMFRGTPTQINFYNNIMQRPATNATYGDIGVGLISALGTWDYNLYDSSPTMIFHYNSEANTATGLTAWRTASSKDTNSTTTSDPLFAFTGTDADQFILQGGSAALTLGAGGTEIGPWAGQTQIGCDF